MSSENNQRRKNSHQGNIHIESDCRRSAARDIDKTAAYNETYNNKDVCPELFGPTNRKFRRIGSAAMKNGSGVGLLALFSLYPL
jgi:hypothetical protein